MRHDLIVDGKLVKSTFTYFWRVPVLWRLGFHLYLKRERTNVVTDEGKEFYATRSPSVIPDPELLCRGCGGSFPECGDLCDYCAGLLRDDLAEADMESEQ